MLTVWAQQAPPAQHHRSHGNQHQQQQQDEQKSIELVNKSVEKWLSDAHCTTVLCQPTGQVSK